MSPQRAADRTRTALARVVVNGRFLTQPVTGVQRYGREVLGRLVEKLPDMRVVLPGRGRVPAAGAMSGAAGQGPGGIRGHWWEQRRLPHMLREGDLLVGFANWGPVGVADQVVTIYDTAPIRAAANYAARYRWLTRVLQPRLANAARTVVTISERSRLDLSADFGVDPGRIVVIPPGVGAPFTPQGPRHPHHSPYALFVGAHDPRKNFDFLAELWPSVRRRHGLDLIAVGRARSRPHRSAKRRLPEGVVVVSSPGDDGLAALYRGAECVVSASSYEGFGLPLLEGMACGAPFVAADAGAARDLAVDAGLQVQPLEQERWRSAIGDVLRERTQLSSASLRQAAAYSWDATAVAWMGLIDDLLEGR